MISGVNKSGGYVFDKTCCARCGTTQCVEMLCDKCETQWPGWISGHGRLVAPRILTSSHVEGVYANHMITHNSLHNLQLLYPFINWEEKAINASLSFAIEVPDIDDWLNDTQSSLPEGVFFRVTTTSPEPVKTPKKKVAKEDVTDFAKILFS